MDYNIHPERKEILEFYNTGKEVNRLYSGIGRLEFARTKEIISRYLSPQSQVIYDIGGGSGEYSRWLAKSGHEVHLLELSPHLVEYAKAANKEVTKPIFNIEIADAVSLKQEDESADAVLMLGPLYHLVARSNRLKALREAKRVLKKGGLLFAAAISRYSSTLWGLSVFGENNDVVNDEMFLQMIDRELSDGQHIRPERFPRFIARSFFHLPEELRAEIVEAGFIRDKVLAVEGPIWLVPAFEEKWSWECSREKLLEICRKVETDESILGMSPHLLAVARKLW